MRSRWPVLNILVVAWLCGTAHAEVWSCRNDLEVQCASDSCSAETEQGNFTPMSLAFSSSGSFSLCAYSGCWDAEGTVVSTAPFLVIAQARAEWSDPSSRGERDADVLIAFDTRDRIALIKAGGFATPLHCELQSERAARDVALTSNDWQAAPVTGGERRPLEEHS